MITLGFLWLPPVCFLMCLAIWLISEGSLSQQSTNLGLFPLAWLRTFMVFVRTQYLRELYLSAELDGRWQQQD